MIKLIGAILLITGASLWGFGAVKNLKNRADALAAVASSLEIMGHELCDNLTPVPRLFERLERDARYPANRLYSNGLNRLKGIGAEPFYELWRRAVCDTHELMLNEQETLALSEIGLSLGRYDIEEQRKAVDNAIFKFNGFAKSAKEEWERNRKSQAFLGVTAGLFAVIILL